MKKSILLFSFSLFALAGIAQTAVTNGKTPATEPASADVSAAKTTATPTVVLSNKQATTLPAPAAENTNAQPASPADDKTTSQKKQPE